MCDEAVELATFLANTRSTAMVNWDLHYGNVLYALVYQTWVAIDPKPVIGLAESGIAQLLWTRVTDFVGPKELQWHLVALIDGASLDARLTLAWTRVRVVDFWLWELGVGLTNDPSGCARIPEWLGPAEPLPSPYDR